MIYNSPWRCHLFSVLGTHARSRNSKYSSFIAKTRTCCCLIPPFIAKTRTCCCLIPPFIAKTRTCCILIPPPLIAKTWTCYCLIPHFNRKNNDMLLSYTFPSSSPRPPTPPPPTLSYIQGPLNENRSDGF